MKYLLPLVCGLFLLSSCDKMFLKRTKVQIIYDTPETDFYFPNDGAKHLSGQNAEAIYATFYQKLVDQLNKGKMDVVSAGHRNSSSNSISPDADYVVVVQSMHFTEDVMPSLDETGVLHQVSKLTVTVNYSVEKPYSDKPHYLQTSFTLSEHLAQNQSKETDKSKDKVYDDDGNKTYECNKDCYYVDTPGQHIIGFGGLNRMLEDHSEEIRKELKKYFKSQQ